MPVSPDSPPPQGEALECCSCQKAVSSSKSRMAPPCSVFPPVMEGLHFTPSGISPHAGTGNELGQGHHAECRLALTFSN